MSGSPGVHALGRLVDLRRALHVQGLVRTLVVEDSIELVEPSCCCRKLKPQVWWLLSSGQMHALMAAVLLRMTRLDPFNANA